MYFKLTSRCCLPRRKVIIIHGSAAAGIRRAVTTASLIPVEDLGATGRKAVTHIPGVCMGGVGISRSK